MNKLPVQKLNFEKLTETHFRKHTDKQENTKIHNKYLEYFPWFSKKD